MTVQLVVDIGKSQIRAAEHAGSQARVFSPTGASPARLARDGLIEQVARTLEALRVRTGRPADPVARVLIASTTAFSESDSARLGRRLHGSFSDAEVLLCDDGVAMHAAALGGPGTMIGIGTGTTMFALGAVGPLRRRDGWGPVYGDRGSAFDLGRRGLVEAFRDVENDRESPLRTRAEGLLGALTLDIASIAMIADGWIAEVASFARDVSDLAARGDVAAGGLVEESVRELVETAESFGPEMRAWPVAILGRLGSGIVGDRLSTVMSDRGFRVCEPRSTVLDLDPEWFARSMYRAHADRIS